MIDYEQSPSKSRPRRQRSRSVFLLVAVALFVLAWLLAPRELSITDPKLPHVKAPSLQMTETYFWDSGEKLNWIHQQGLWQFAPNLKTWHEAIGEYGHTIGMISSTEINETTGKAVPGTTTLSAHIAPSPEGGYILNTSFSDGKWMWFAIPKKPTKSRWRSLLDSFSVCWLPDGRRIVTIREVADMHMRLVVSDVEHPGQQAEYSLGVWSVYPEVLGPFGANEVAVIKWLGNGQNEYEILVYSVAPRLALLRTIHVNVPADKWDSYPVYCAKTHRFAWVVDRSADISLWGKISSRILRRPYSAYQELWISELNCSNWRKIGILETFKKDQRITSLQWLPDGKRLSVLIKDTIWIVPAE